MVRGMPCAEWRQAMQNETVQRVLNEGPAEQANQRKGHDLPALRARAGDHEESCQAHRSGTVQRKVGAVGQLAVLQREKRCEVHG